MNRIRPFEHLHRVYCAGPLFNAAERREMSQIAKALRDGGFEAFVPHADGFEFANVLPCLIEQGCDPTLAGHYLHSAIFALDSYQVLLGCGSLVFNMNGRTPDEGGVAEMTMAWMIGKPVVIYKEDVRSAISGRDNPLVVGQADFETIDDLQQLPAALSQRIARLGHECRAEIACPPHLQTVLATGETFWRRLQALQADRPSDILAQWVLELFGCSGQLAEA